MTKMKSKKMTKSTFAIIIMAIAIVALLAFGGSYAYFTATTTAKSNTFETGIVNLSAGDFTISTAKVVPGDPLVNKAVVYNNQSNVKSYIFVKLTIDDENLPSGKTVDDFVAVTMGEGWTDYTDTQAGVYYRIVEDAAANTEAVPYTFASAITLNPALVSNSHNGSQGTSMGIQITLSIQGRAIQYMEDVATAYSSAFAATEAVL